MRSIQSTRCLADGGWRKDLREFGYCNLDRCPISRVKTFTIKPVDRAQAYSIHGWCSGGIHPYLRQINNPAKVVDVAEAADGIVTNSAAAIYESFTIANDMLNGRDWFFDHFIPADMHFFWCYRRAKQFELDLERFNHCQAHFDRVSERPSVVKVLELENQSKQNLLPELAHAT